MTGSPSLLSGCLQPCSMHPSTGEGFLLGFIPLPSDTLCKGFGCQGSHEPTHCSTITSGAASCCRKGFVLWHRVCHCCDTWGQPCPAVLSHMGPASGMLCGTLCSSITGAVPSALLPYPAQQTLCPAMVSDGVLVLYLPDVGVEWGVPCGCFSRACWCLVRALEGNALTRDPQNMLHGSLQSFLFLCKTSSLGFCHTSSLIMREWKGL